MPISVKRRTAELVIKQQLKLTPCIIFTFDRISLNWLELTDNFYNHVHKKTSFKDCSRMDHLVGALKGEAKNQLKLPEKNSHFYATALSTEKRVWRPLSCITSEIDKTF